jgi:hypothetical protein
MTYDRDIKYVNKDFTNYRDQLIEFSKSYFPDTYNDFSPTSPGMMFIEMAAYVGDVLSFYQDIQLQETYLQYAKNPSNLYTLAYMMGYKPKVTAVSQVDVTLSQTVGVDGGGNPDWNQAMQIAANAQLTSTSGGNLKFIVDKPVDFKFSSSYDPTDVQVETLAGSAPATFTLTKTARATSGEMKTQTEVITSVEKFKTITVSDTNIVGIVSIVDSNNNVWYEVPFLGQDTVFKDSSNTSSDSAQVPYLLTLQKVPRRFITRLDSSGVLSIQFGSGITGQDDSVLTPDPTNVGFGSTQGITRIDYAYDPSNFLNSQAYGLAPSNTNLTITYLVGGGVESNVPANTITTVSATKSANDPLYIDTLTVNNSQAATGGKDGDSVDDLRQNSMKAFNEQGRAVTLQDYTVRALSLPSKYGSIAKIYVTQDQLTNPNSSTDNILDSNPLSLSMYMLAYDLNKNLVNVSTNLKNNLKQYLAQYMILTDALNLKDAFVVNMELDFDIIVQPNYIGGDVLVACTEKLKEYFDITKWSINQPVNISSLYTLLDQVKGVQTVQKIRLINKVGGDYSQYAYDLDGATRNNVLYPSYDPMIFEIKFPDTDIKGRITTL